MDAPLHPGLKDALNFPLVAALLGRRSRRFFLGAEIPDGPLAFRSAKAALPLSEAEQMLVLLAVSGNTGWHYAIPRHGRYSPHLPNYAAAAGGRTLPSAAGFHTSEVFFTNDQGVFFLATRDAPALAEPGSEGRLDLEALLSAHRGRIRQLAPAASGSRPASPTWRGTTPGWPTGREPSWSFRPPTAPSTTSPTSATTCRTATPSTTTSAGRRSRGSSLSATFSTRTTCCP